MTQEWFLDSVVYQIMIDRFAGVKERENWHNPEYIGGDLKGIKERLDYLEGLGVDVIWISPFYEGKAYHGYHITDMYSVDPEFGTEEDLKELIEEVHERDMRIIADFVPNHVSVEHEYFREASTFPNSEYRDWFYFNEWPDKYLSFLDFDQDLAKLNLENEDARQHVVDAAKKWLELGLDGYRLDHVIGPSHGFWNHFEQKISEEFPEAVLIGESWWNGIGFEHLETFEMPRKYLNAVTGSQELAQRNYIGLLDGVLDFKAREIVLSILDSDLLPDSLVRPLLRLHYSHYPGSFSLPNFLDNHDTNRVLYELDQDTEKLKEAFDLMLEQSQPTVIYYGTEIGMTQHQSISDFEDHGDLQARQPMNWKEGDKELLRYFQKKIHGN
jgi:glycosidase